MKNKIPMNISIQTDQNIETPQGEPVSESVHTNAFGFLRETKNGMELEYLESKDKTFGDTVTTVSMLKDNIVAVNRIGALNTYMVFEEGKAHTCLYTGERVPVQRRSPYKQTAAETVFHLRAASVISTTQSRSRATQRNAAIF